jgi:hypothetical protein
MQRYLEQDAQDADGGDGYYYGDDLNNSVACPSWAPIVGFTGIACAVCFASEYRAGTVEDYRGWLRGKIGRITRVCRFLGSA